MKLVLILIVVAVLTGIVLQVTYLIKRKKSIKKLGFDPKQTIKTGKYTIGHPDIDKHVDVTEIIPKNSALVIIGNNNSSAMDELAEIPFEGIKNITIEDASTMEKRVTAGRLLAVGVFAFALKKKKKQGMSYLCIEWKDSRFEHETIFEFVGKTAVQDGNSARNQLIKAVR